MIPPKLLNGDVFAIDTDVASEFIVSEIGTRVVSGFTFLIST